MRPTTSNEWSIIASRATKFDATSSAAPPSHSASRVTATRWRRTSHHPPATRAAVHTKAFRPHGTARSSASPTIPASVAAARMSSPRRVRSLTTLIVPAPSWFPTRSNSAASSRARRTGTRRTAYRSRSASAGPRPETPGRRTPPPGPRARRRASSPAGRPSPTARTSRARRSRRSSRRRLGQAAEAALARPEIAHGTRQLRRAEVGPHGVGEVQLGIGGFPQEEVREPLLAAGANQEVDVGENDAGPNRPAGRVVDRQPELEPVASTRGALGGGDPGHERRGQPNAPPHHLEVLAVLLQRQ